MNHVLRASFAASALLCATALSMAHTIKLLSRSSLFNTPSVSSGVNHTYGGSVAPDDDFAYRLKFMSTYGIQGYYPQSGNRSAQQGARARFELEWIPDNPSDLPGSTAYGLLVDVFLSIGTSAGGAQISPPNTPVSIGSIAQIFLESEESSWTNTGSPPYFDADGDSPSDIDNDEEDARELVAEDYPCSVVFEEKDGKYIGTADFVVAFDGAFTYSAPYPISHFDMSAWAGVLIRAKAVSCAGVNVTN